MVSYEQKINDLETVLMAMHELGQKYYSEMLRLQGQITELEKSKEELERKLNDAKSNYENEIRKNERVYADSLNKMRESYREEVNKLQTTNKKMHPHIDKLEKIIDELTEKELALNNDIANFKKEKDDWDKEKKDIIQERDSYKDKCKELKTQLHNALGGQNNVKKEENADCLKDKKVETEVMDQAEDNSAPSLDNIEDARDDAENASIHNEVVKASIQKDKVSENSTIGKKSDAHVPNTVKPGMQIKRS